MIQVLNIQKPTIRLCPEKFALISDSQILRDQKISHFHIRAIVNFKHEINIVQIVRAN